MSSIIWQKAPPLPMLRRNEIHIWRASLAQWADFPANILSPAELQRGGRFIREAHQRRFCLARAFLRLILARYLSIAPAQILFREGAHGKLYLAQSDLNLQFNLSHSQDLALYAITLEQEIGIDIEWIDAHLAVQPLAARVMTPSEYQAFQALPDTHQQLAAFYQLWTRKEAYLKASGLGLSGLSQSKREEKTACIITNLDPAPGYAGAWALMNPCERLLQPHYFQI